MVMNVIIRTGLACMFRQQTFLLPVTMLWYQANGLTAADFVSIQGIFILLGLFVEVPSGYIADMFSKKRILLFSFTLFLLRCLLWLSFTGLVVIIVGELLVLLSRSFFQGIYDSYIFEYLKKEQETDKMMKYCGIVTCFTNVGTGTASLLCSVLYPQYSLYVLLSLELIATVIAIALICTLPNIKVIKMKKSISQRGKEIWQAVISTLRDSRINHYILLTAVFASSTYVFIWSFQPIMKITGVALGFFGVVYFFNFLFRALASYFTSSIVQKFGYKKLAIIVAMHIFVGLSGMIISYELNYPFVTLGFVFLICIGIGFQLAFNILTVTKIQEIAPSEVRATKSSTNNMISQGVSGIILTSFKFISNEADFLIAYIVVFIVYALLLGGLYVWKFKLK